MWIVNNNESKNEKILRFNDGCVFYSNFVH